MIMALSSNKRQKKLQKKAKNRKKNLEKKKNKPVFSTSKAINYSSYPIHECFVPDGLFETGLGSILISRQTPQGKIAFSSFVVDVFCLGIKDCFFRVFDELEYEFIKSQIQGSHESQNFKNISPSCALKIVNGAIDYAKELGFSPHPDFNKDKHLFGNINVDNCSDEYSYGKNGKPFYFQCPHETPATVKKIINRLQEKCGLDGFDFIVLADDEFDF